VNASLFAVFCLAACSVDTHAKSGEQPLFEGKNVTLVSENGSTVQAHEMVLQQDGNGRANTVQAKLQTEADVDGPPPLEIVAQHSKWDLKTQVVTFTGDVIAVRGPVTMNCATLVVEMDENKQVERAVATGNVELLRGDRVAHGERAVLTTKTGEVVLSENPVLVEGPHKMTGDTITLWLDEERVECEACRLVVDGQAVVPR